MTNHPELVIDALSLVVERSRLLTANDRHRHPVAAAAKAAVLRDAARAAASALPKQAPSLILVTLQFPSSPRRDPANWHPSLKPMLDGLVLAGVLPDDSAEYVQGPLPVIGPKDPSLSTRFGRRVTNRVRLTWAFHPMLSDFSGRYHVRREVHIG